MFDLVLENVSVRLAPDFRLENGLWLGLRDGKIAYRSGGPPDGFDGRAKALKGGFLLEPFCDAHVHLFLTGSFDNSARLAAASLSRNEKLDRILGILEGYWRMGIFRVRDGGDPFGLALSAARIANANPARYASVMAVGEPVFRKGKYGGFLGGGVETLEEAVRLIARNREEGAACVKILATGINSLEKPGEAGGLQFTKAELKALVKFAKGQGMGSMVHANGPCREIIEAAPDSLEHGFWMEDEDLTLLAGSETVWTPTYGAWSALSDYPGLSPRNLKVVEATAGRQAFQIGLAASLGVKVAAGSDAGTPGVSHGEGLFREFKLLEEAGLTRERSFMAAQREASRLCGFRAKGLAEGDEACFIHYGADPFQNQECLLRPIGVYRGGYSSFGEVLR